MFFVDVLVITRALLIFFSLVTSWSLGDLSQVSRISFSDTNFRNSASRLLLRLSFNVGFGGNRSLEAFSIRLRLKLAPLVRSLCLGLLVVSIIALGEIRLALGLCALVILLFCGLIVVGEFSLSMQVGLVHDFGAVNLSITNLNRVIINIAPHRPRYHTQAPINESDALC